MSSYTNFSNHIVGGTGYSGIVFWYHLSMWGKAVCACHQEPGSPMWEKEDTGVRSIRLSKHSISECELDVKV